MLSVMTVETDVAKKTDKGQLWIGEQPARTDATAGKVKV